MSVFGALLDAGSVEDAVMDTLKKWLDTYLAEVERQTDRTPGSIKRPSSWVNVNEFSQWQKFPCIMIVSPGLSDEPVRDGQGYYRAIWTLGIAAVVSARSESETLSLSRAYGAAIRGVMLQNRSLGGRALGVHWLDEKYDDIPEERRVIKAARLIFDVEMDKVTSTKEGPTQPDPLPGDPPPSYGDWPEAESVTVEGRMK